jgi:hypothetical protein
MSFSNAKAAEILNNEFRSDPVYLALYTSNPTGADTGAEVSGGGYARQEITFSVPALEDGKETIKNSAKVEFPVATADWGTVTHIGIRDAATAGALIAFAALQTPRTILTGDRFVIDLNNGVVKLS